MKSSLLADSVVSASAIDVDTLAGTVSLNGIVTSEQERQRAIQLARRIQGVKQVDARNLMVGRLAGTHLVVFMRVRKLPSRHAIKDEALSLSGG